MSDQSEQESENPDHENRIESEGIAGISAKGEGRVVITNSQIDNSSIDTAVEVSDDVTVEADHLAVDNVRSTGVHVSDGNFIARNIMLNGGKYGLDLHRGARGDLFDSQITGQTEDSIRYDRDVLYGLHDVEAMSLRDRVRGDRTTEDNKLHLNNVLDTTSEQLNLENRIETYRQRIQYLLLAGSLYGLGDSYLF